MEINYSFFADAASVDANQKVNALGIHDNIFAHKTPVIYPRMYYVVNIHFHRAEYGYHKVKISFVNPDGAPIVPVHEMDIVVDGNRQNSVFIVEYQNVIFSVAGPHAVDVVISGRHVGSKTLNIKQI